MFEFLDRQLPGVMVAGVGLVVIEWQERVGRPLISVGQLLPAMIVVLAV